VITVFENNVRIRYKLLTAVVLTAVKEVNVGRVMWLCGSAAARDESLVGVSQSFSCRYRKEFVAFGSVSQSVVVWMCQLSQLQHLNVGVIESLNMGC